MNIDSILSNFDVSSAETDEKVELAPITLWIPKVSKIKFDRLQSDTKRKFGKVLKDVVVASIELKSPA